MFQIKLCLFELLKINDIKIWLDDKFKTNILKIISFKSKFSEFKNWIYL